MSFGKTRNIIVLYLLSTLVYYFFGRQEWIIPSQIKLLLFVMLNILAFYFGYTFYIKKKLNGVGYDETTNSELIYTKRIRMIFIISCLLLIVFQISTVVTTIGSFRISNVFQTIGENYKDRLSIIRSSMSEGSERILIMQIQTLFWGTTMFAYPIGYMYFKKMRVFDKTLLFITIIIDFFSTLNLGITKNIGDFILIIIACIIISAATSPKVIKKRNKHSTTKIIAIIIFFLMIFSMIQYSREKAYNIQTGTNLYPQFSLLREDTVFDIILFKNRILSDAVDKIGVYVSHGYTGLAYAMELPHQNTYGLGVSRALINYANQYLGINVSPQTFNERIQLLYGWPNGSLWPTAYTWIANSVSFWLVPFVIFLFGFFMAKVEYRYKTQRDIYSLALFCQLFIGAMYLPANAQLVQSKPSWWALVLLLVVYNFTRGKKQREKTKLFHKV